MSPPLCAAARLAHALPWIAARGHSLSSPLASTPPPLFPHPLTHWRKAWGPSVLERLLLVSQATIFCALFLFKTQKAQAATYATPLSITAQTAADPHRKSGRRMETRHGCFSQLNGAENSFQDPILCKKKFFLSIICACSLSVNPPEKRKVHPSLLLLTYLASHGGS